MTKLLAASLVLLAACGSRPDPWRHGVVESRRVEAGSKTGGRVTEVLVSEGAIVEAGTPLVRFDTAELLTQRDLAQSRLAEAEARVLQLRRGLRREEVEQAAAAALQARSQWEAVRNGPRPQEIEQARAELRSLEADLANAESQRARIEALFRSGDVSQQNFDDAAARTRALRERRAALAQRVALLEAGTRREEVAAAEQRMVQAEKAAAVARAGSRAEEIAQAEARVAQARAEVARIGVLLSEAEVRAPSRCRVEAVGVRPGDLVPAGRASVSLLEEDQTWVRVYIPEPDLASWPVGAVVEVQVEGLSGPGLPGKIEQVAAQAEFLPRNIQTREDRSHQVFGIKVRLDGPARVRSGMAASVRLKAVP